MEAGTTAKQLQSKHMRCLFILVLGFLMLSQRCNSQELPIKPARTVSFSTDEGTYMNVDLSPDGRTLLFDLLGDLYTVPVAGGKARQLTRGIALHLRPVWSPDGKMIAYMSDVSGMIHPNIMDVAGTWHKTLGREDPPMGEGDDLVWTPDGHFVIANDKAYGIIAYSIGGGKLPAPAECDRTVGTAKGQEGRRSPDGRWWVNIADSSGNRCLLARDLANDSVHVLVPALFGTKVGYFPSVPSPHFCFTADSKYLFIF
jgi:Tol biopolymer transport system component